MNMVIGRCPKCNSVVYNNDFNDNQQALLEFAKNGLCNKCQYNFQIFNVDYFIEKFSNIPEDKWAESGYQNGDKFCALGHCGEIVSDSPTEESIALQNLFTKYDLRVSLVNDGEYSKYEGKSPKQRIIDVLKYIKQREEKII